MCLVNIRKERNQNLFTSVPVLEFLCSSSPRPPVHLHILPLPQFVAARLCPWQARYPGPCHMYLHSLHNGSTMQRARQRHGPEPPFSPSSRPYVERKRRGSLSTLLGWSEGRTVRTQVHTRPTSVRPRLLSQKRNPASALCPAPSSRASTPWPVERLPRLPTCSQNRTMREHSQHIEPDQTSSLPTKGHEHRGAQKKSKQLEGRMSFGKTETPNREPIRTESSSCCSWHIRLSSAVVRGQEICRRVRLD